MLHIGQGDIMVAKRTSAGAIESLRDIGEAPVIEVEINTDKVTDNETSSGMRRQNLSVITKQEAMVTITLKEPTLENLEFMLYGTQHDIAGVTLTNALMPDDLVAGVRYRLPQDVTQVSDLVIRDSAGTPVILTAGTHYEADTVFGTIMFTSAGISTKTQPFKVSCESSDETGVSLMDNIPENVTIIAHVVNTADDFAPEIWELYNVQLDPTDKLPAKGEKAAEFTLKGSVLIDPKKPKGGTWGQFGRIRRLAAEAAA